MRARRLFGHAEGVSRISVVSSNQYGGATTESAFAAAENLLSSHKDVQGIFCPNESTTFGMLRALEAAGRAGKVKFVGFDASDKLVSALRPARSTASSYRIHFAWASSACGARWTSSGKPVKRVDTGATMVTRENMATPGVRALLSPELTSTSSE